MNATVSRLWLALLYFFVQSSMIHQAVETNSSIHSLALGFIALGFAVLALYNIIVFICYAILWAVNRRSDK